MERGLESLTKPAYTSSILRVELNAIRHMMGREHAVYHVLYGETDIWMLGRAARMTGNAAIASFHDGPSILEGCGITERLLTQLDAVICLGKTQQKYFAARMPPERIFVVPHGVSSDFFTPDDDTPKERLCVTAGGHTRDFETLAEAIRLVWEVDPDIRFVAIGTHHGHEGPPFDLGGVTYLSGISDESLRDYYRRASVAVFAFEWAVANNAVLEAMACGTPIVATDIGSVPEYVPPEAGVLTPPRDPQAMADAILALMADGARVEALGTRARAAAAMLDYRHVAAQLDDVYQTVGIQARSARKKPYIRRRAIVPRKRQSTAEVED
jgi:glycosyltransferase involved in cell wall biosynthesis